MKSFEANFVANAGVKDIVGKGLIYDDNIALIELVKNAKDAKSESVEIYFRKAKDENNKDVSEIAIYDFGNGMTQSDIVNKWLNIAYSEKKGSVDSFAGSKGVGRFSCDRLGEKLVLFTKSIAGEFIKLPIDWAVFENKGIKDEISKIKLSGQVISESEFKKSIGKSEFKKGTVLKIQSLRADWTSKKQSKLISELEKFSPALEEDFDVYFYAEKEFDENGESLKLEDGKINNNILSKIAFKTTYIKSRIDTEGKFIFTQLFFQGEEIYSYKAINPYSTLKGITSEIHYLDTISKAYFTRKAGVSSVKYGSVFLFYNGFRVSPYGNPKNDWLGLDQRKSQGTSRNLGTREVFGRIDISDPDNTFSVITSREGLAHDNAYFDLVAYDEDEKTILNGGKQEYGYVTTIIRQLENFVVNGLSWNRMLDKSGVKNIVTLDDVNKDPERYVVKDISSDDVISVLNKMLKSTFEIESVEINKRLIENIKETNDKKFEAYKNDFVERIEDKSIADLSPSEKGIVKKIIKEAESRVEAVVEERDFAEEVAKKAQVKLSAETQKNRYLLATRKSLSKDADGLLHTITINNTRVRNVADILIDDILHGEINRNNLLLKLSEIRVSADKSLKMSELATRSDLDTRVEDKKIDLPIFIEEYLKVQVEAFHDDLSLEFVNSNKSYSTNVNLLGLTIVLDNLVSNSEKWGAKNISISFDFGHDGGFYVLFSDDGEGLSSRFENNPEVIFELGVRDVPDRDYYLSGSGIGLSHSKELLEEMNAKISFKGNGVVLNGACFEMEFA